MKDVLATLSLAACFSSVAFPALATVSLNVSVAGTPGMLGHATYTLRFTSDTGTIGSFRGFGDFNGSALDPIAVSVQSPATLNPTNTSRPLVDGTGPLETHFLLTSDQIQSVVFPFETSTQLGGIFTIEEPFRQQSLDLIQVVAPVDAVVGLNIGVSESTDPTSAQTTRIALRELIIRDHALAGDANLDGQVTLGDFSNLQNNFNQAGGWAEGDFNGDGLVTIGDFSILQNNFGAGGAAASLAEADFVALEAFAATAPEPTAALLLGLSGLFIGRRRLA